jgi:hypothetical protein
MNELKEFQFSSFKEHQSGGVVVPVKFNSVESASICISNLIEAISLIAGQGDSLDHCTAEEILMPVRGITDVLKGMYNENLLYDIHIIDQVRALQKK